MAKRYYTTDKTGEEVEVSKEIAKQLVDSGKKKIEDFEIEFAPFDPNDFEFEELPEGDTGASPVDIQGQDISPSLDLSEVSAGIAPSSTKLGEVKDVDRFGGLGLQQKEPTQEGGLPILESTGVTSEQESFQRGTAAIADMFSLPERAMGGVFNSDEGRSILQEMADADASVLKQWKKDIRKKTSGPSHNPFRRLAGIILEAGGSVVSDPTTYFTAALGLAKAGVKGFAKGTVRQTAKDTPQTGIPISADLQKQVSQIVPGGQVPQTIKGVDMTPSEIMKIGGREDAKVFAREAVLKQTGPGEAAVETLTKSRKEGFPTRIELQRTGIDDLLQGSTDLTGKIAKDFDSAFKKFEAQTKKGFAEVQKTAGKDAIDVDLSNVAISDLNELLPPEAISRPITARRGAELTDKEIGDLVRKNEFNPKVLYDENGKFVSQKAVDESLKIPVLSSAELRKKGFTKQTISQVNDAIEIFGSNPTFKELRNARQTIYELEGLFITKKLNARSKDMETLVGLRKSYTDAMENHMEKVGGEEARKLFRATDDEYIDKVGINILKKNFYTKAEDGIGLVPKTPDKVFESLLKGENVATKLHQLEKALSPKSFDELRKAYFNSIFEKASLGTGGMVSPEKLINTVERMKGDVFLWETLLTNDMKDILAKSVLDAYVFKKLKTFKTPKALESNLKQVLKGASGSGLSFAISRTFGFGKMAAFRAATFMIKRGLKATESKQAVDFFKGVDAPGFMQGLKEGGRGIALSVPTKAKKTLREIDPRKQVDIKGTEFLRPTPRALVETTIDEQPTLETTP